MTTDRFKDGYAAADRPSVTDDARAGRDGKSEFADDEAEWQRIAHRAMDALVAAGRAETTTATTEDALLEGSTDE